MQPTRLASTALLALLVLAGCGDKAPDPSDGAAWTRVAAAALSEAQRGQRTRGLAAKEAMFTQLKARLVAAMADGPENVVGVCKLAAPAVAAETGEAHALRIGRTSFKLRSAANAPPPWAAPLMAERVAEPAWLAHADGRLAGLLPIRMLPLCVRCHGEAGAIPAPIRSELERLYPDDEATGFAAGDLRGWFWLEIPPR